MNNMNELIKVTYDNDRPIHFLHSDGRPDTKMNTCWTQKGRMMIHNILTGRGIVALMDREGV